MPSVRSDLSQRDEPSQSPSTGFGSPGAVVSPNPRPRFISLRTKLAILLSALVAGVSLVLVWYLPSRVERSARSSMVDTATSVAAMGAHALGESVASGEPVSGAPILRALRESSDLVYIVATDTEQTVLAAFNQPLAEISGFDEPRLAQPVELNSPVRSETRGGFTSDGRIYQSVAPIRDRGALVGNLYLGFSMDRHLEALEASRTAVAISSLFLLGLGVAGAWILTGYLTAPLEKVVTTIRRTSEGARGERADVNENSEVGILARAFNEMLSRLEAAQEGLEAMNSQLEQRVRAKTDQLREEFEKRLRTQTALVTSEARYSSLVERNLAGVYVAGTDGTILDANPACARMFGHESVEDLVLKGRITYLHESDAKKVMSQLETEGVLSNFEVEMARKDGASFWALKNARLIREEDVIEGIVLDVTERKLTELEIEYRAHHDPLTELPNRTLLLDRLEMAVANARRQEFTVAVLFIDIDDLKAVNDVLGHSVGDEVLRRVGGRLNQALRSGDTVARIGGDEFVVVLPAIPDDAAARRVAEILRTSFEQPIVLGNEEIRLTASLGVSVYPTDGQDAEELLLSADSSMYRAKVAGGNRVLTSADGESSKGLRRSSLERELRAAISRGELVPYYQPQYDLVSRELLGFEALVRWQHPEGLLVEPAGFISTAEQSGLILPLGVMILRQACSDARKWQEDRPGLQIGVNVSARQFHQKDFLEVVLNVVSETGIDPETVELEITESIALQKSRWTFDLLEKIRAAGIRIAVDDFGTGRSSLVYLKEFPFDTVKLDLEFIRGVLKNDHDRSIVSAILEMSQSLGLRTVAEGIEQEEQCSFLEERGCTLGQGFFFSPAVPASEVEEMLEKQSPPQSG